MTRTERLFAIAEVLRGRRSGITASALAERFEVSTRTVMRDLEALRSAALPIHGERGRGGGVALDRRYRMPPIALTAREAVVLLVLARFARQTRIIPFMTTLDAAFDKIRAALPADVERQLTGLERRLSFVTVPAHPVRADVRAVVEDAWIEGHPLRITYEKPDGTTVERTIAITSIVLERTETLLNCVDRELDAARQFRLHRVRKAIALDDGGG